MTELHRCPWFYELQFRLQTDELWEDLLEGRWVALLAYRQRFDLHGYTGRVVQLDDVNVVLRRGPGPDQVNVIPIRCIVRVAHPPAPPWLETTAPKAGSR